MCVREPFSTLQRLILHVQCKDIILHKRRFLVRIICSSKIKQSHQICILYNTCTCTCGAFSDMCMPRWTVLTPPPPPEKIAFQSFPTWTLVCNNWRIDICVYHSRIWYYRWLVSLTYEYRPVSTCGVMWLAGGGDGCTRPTTTTRQARAPERHLPVSGVSPQIHARELTGQTLQNATRCRWRQTPPVPCLLQDIQSEIRV